ncbi:MAG: hypothetical protein ACRDCW_05315 [Sarcina sp.]
MLANVQPTMIENINATQTINSEVAKQKTKTVKVKVINEEGVLVKSYEMSGRVNETVANQIKQQPNIIEVLNNGKKTTVRDISDLTFRELGDTITIVVKDGLGIKPQYSIDDNLESLPLSNENSDEAGVDVIIINQYGEELLTKQINNANGYILAQFVANAKNPIESVTYNGKNVTVADLLEQNYEPNTNNLFVIKEHTNSPIYVNGIIGVNRRVQIVGEDNIVNSQGAKLEIPSGLSKNFDITTITINNIKYKGYFNGESYIIKAFIPSAPEYVVNLDLVRN